MHWHGDCLCTFSDNLVKFLTLTPREGLPITRPGTPLPGPASVPAHTYRVSGVQRVVFALSKDLYQFEDFVVDLGHQVPQDVAPHASQLNLLQLQKLNGRFIKVLAQGGKARGPSAQPIHLQG